MKKPSPLRIAKAVLSGFFALRKRADFEKDLAALELKHVIIGAVVLMTVFVTTLVLIVRMIVR